VFSRHRHDGVYYRFYSRDVATYFRIQRRNDAVFSRRVSYTPIDVARRKGEGDDALANIVAYDTTSNTHTVVSFENTRPARI